MSELLYRTALTKIPKVGAVTSKNLIAHFGSAEGVFKASRRDLSLVGGVGASIAQSISSAEVLKWAENELQFIEDNAIQVLFHTDANYPRRLKAINDCPMQLYYHGNTDLNAARIVGIVGTRQPSTYGVRHCEDMVDGLKKYNVFIISGLAYGIDITAHRRCVQNKMPTVGIMGNGLQRIYPYEHRETAVAMCENGGLLTEYPSDQSPEAMHFPMRNRIIAGMCDAMVVVETAAKGGSMITANMAADYDRELFAIPGRTDDKKSKGCNDLIRRQRAQLIESAEDIANYLSWTDIDARKAAPQAQLFVELTETEQLIIDSLKKYDNGVVIDALSYDTLLPQSRLASVLLSLEFKGIVRALPGKRFVAN
ncbi:MAG: DNA-processing protein DprA [Saprospiraceae bacterium]|nr:DNA-processing protein DprA [Saprospiraceae bacterium]